MKSAPGAGDRFVEIITASVKWNQVSWRVLQKLGFERTTPVEGSFGPTFPCRLV